jgi:PKD repeat protein
VLFASNLAVEWDPSDAITATGDVVSHVYSQAGGYTAMATTNNELSSSSSITTGKIAGEATRGTIWLAYPV